MNNEDKLDILKNILLTDEREYVSSIENKIKTLEKVIKEREQLSEEVDHVVNEKLDTFVEEIPKNFGPSIVAALEAEIKKSQDTVIETLYPIMGKMIKRYVKSEMQIMLDKINSKLTNTFSFGKQKSKANQKGVSDAELAIREHIKPIIEQIMVIEKNSGILISKYSKTHNIEEEVVAGMLTAIKSFVEDAFHKENQDLQSIEYDTYHIHVQNFSSYYIAVVISGPYNQSFKSKLEDKLLDFAQNIINETDLSNHKTFTKKIERYFF